MCQHELAGCPLITSHLRAGYPPREILRLAQEIGAMLIFMPTQGRHAAVPVVLFNPAGDGLYPELAPHIPRCYED